MNDSQIATPEYIHQVVANFVDDFINRRIFLRETDNMKDPGYVIRTYGEFGDLVRDKYFDTKIIGTERAQLEKQLFDYIVAFTTYNLALPSKINPPLIDQRVDKIERKLDSNNKLLANVLQSLQELKDRMDQDH